MEWTRESQVSVTHTRRQKDNEERSGGNVVLQAQCVCVWQTDDTNWWSKTTTVVFFIIVNPRNRKHIANGSYYTKFSFVSSDLFPSSLLCSWDLRIEILASLKFESGDLPVALDHVLLGWKGRKGRIEELSFVFLLSLSLSLSLSPSIFLSSVWLHVTKLDDEGMKLAAQCHRQNRRWWRRQGVTCLPLSCADDSADCQRQNRKLFRLLRFIFPLPLRGMIHAFPHHRRRVDGFTDLHHWLTN